MPSREEQLRALLTADPTRHDLAYQLAMLLMQDSRPVSPELEEAALRHAIAEHPNRIDLVDRLVHVVTQATLTAAATNADEQPSASDRAVLQRARARLEQVRETPPATDLPPQAGRWEVFAERMRAEIARFETVKEALHFAQTDVNFDHRSPIGSAAPLHSLCLRELRAEFPAQPDLLPVADIAHALPTTQFLAGDRVVSNVSLYWTRIVLGCLALLPAPPRTILEIGGGYGGPCWTWLTSGLVQPPERYVIADLAESLFFADVFLSDQLGLDRVLYVEDTAALTAEALDGYTVVLCPVDRLQALESISLDLVVNTGSMQEMSDAWIHFYARWLDRQKAQHFYSLNYFAQPIGFLAESANLWAPRPSPRWTARALRLNPPMIRMQADRNFLEALYERTDQELDLSEAHRRLHALSERTATLETFCETVEIFRRRPCADTALAALGRARDLSFEPKEALEIAQWTLDNVGDVGPTARSEIEAYVVRLQAARRDGIEATV